ncbi:MAG: discoidin domain-containing protein [Clostridia bacterium]|nr:discoidin domain-containing protein [Clostridia bacterium]
MPKLSKTSIKTFCGNIVTLMLISSKDISKEDIIWTSSDESIVYIRDFKQNGTPNFSEGVLLVMMGEGTANVKAEFNGNEYTCLVESREMKKASPLDNFNFYFGDFHTHTSQNHKKDEFPLRTDTTPLTVLKEIKDEAFFDCTTISDHACLVNNREFFRVFLSAEETENEGFIVFPGTECEVAEIEYDRHGIAHKNAGEIVTFNTHGYASVDIWDKYYKEVYKNPCAIASFAHPQIMGWSVKGIWNFSFDRKIRPEMREMFRLIEVGNGGDRAQNLVHERMYSKGLDCGLKLSPVSTSDWHGPKWGASSLRGKTIILSPQKSKEYFIDAIRNNRIYACENGNVKLRYTVNGFVEGSTLQDNTNYKFSVNISHFNKPAEEEKIFLLELVSDYGKTVKSININQKENTNIEFEYSSETARYFYLKLTAKNGDRTWSSPVWTGREFDPVPHKIFEGIELDKSKWSVVSCSKGNDPQKLFSGDYEDAWIGEDTKAEFVIDLGELTDISAIGIYPHTISRFDETLSVTEATARFVSDYELYVADESMDFKLVSKDTVRCYGEEKLDEFETQKARFIKIKILSTAGASQHKEKYKNSPVMIGEIYAYKR